MKKPLLIIMYVSVMLLCSAADVFAQQRPKLKELNDKRYEQALNGVSPWEKKGAYGYADEQGKFFIPPVFRSVMPMGMHNVGFVSYFSEYGSNVWTPISLKGVYLTDLEFDKVVKDFDDRGLAVVRQEGKYGVINHTGKMVAGCVFTNFADKGQVYLLYSKYGGCVAVAKDKSEKGYSAYSFAAGEPVVVEAEGGYGIISPKNYFVVADFEYDSVRELIPNAAYCLQKDGKKYLYAGEKLSHGYEDVIPGSGKSYFVVKQDGKYGAVTTQNATLLSCTQDEMPILKQGEFSCFNEYGLPVYLTVDRRVTPTEYDNYLIEKRKDSFADYLLETTLDYGSKKYIGKAVAALYGTKDFARIQHLPEAVEYAESRRFILLSKDNENAKFFDLNNGRLLNADEVLYHAFPSKSGAPAYASCLRDGKFGIIDIRNKKTVLPFEYDKIKSLEKGYVSLQKGEAYYLYNVTDSLLVTPSACAAIDHFSIAGLEFICVEQNGKERIFNQTLHRWILPEEEELVGIVPVMADKGYLSGLGAFVKKGSKGAMYSISNGERLTDYLFETVSSELFAGKYHVVTAGGKKGLYDLEAQRYVVPCEYSDFLKYDVFKENEYLVVTKAGKQGVYNLTKNKVVVAPLNDEVDIRDGYAGILRSGKYAVFSLEHNKMVFDSPVEYVELMNDGYALLQGPSMCEKGVYNLNWNEWYIDPIPGHDMCFLGGDYVGVEYRGVGNYKTNKLLLEIGDVVVDAFISVERDFIVMADPVEGASMWLYKLDDPDYYLFASSIDLLPEDFIPGCTLAIVADYEYNDGWEITNVKHCQLRNLEGDVILNDSHDGVKFIAMEGLDFGLVRVSMENGEEWLFDALENEWILRSKGKMDIKRSGEYQQIVLPNDRVYLFDPHNSRVLVELKDAFTLQDLKASMEILSSDKYQTEYDGSKWLLRQAYKDNIIATGYDRISLMYEQK